MTKPAYDKLSKSDQETIWDYFDGFGGRYELIEYIVSYLRPSDIKAILKDLDDMREDEENEPPLDTPCLDTSFHDHEMDVD